MLQAIPDALLVNNTLDMLSKQIDEEMNGVTSPMDPIISPTNVSLPNELLSAASLKKKEVETKTSKRKKAWYEKKRRCTKKRGNDKETSTKVCDKKKEKSSKVYDKKKQKCSKEQNASLNHPSLPQEEISESYMVINSFSQIFTGAITDGVIGEF